MKLSEFDYSLPKELIAQYPAKERDKCRLMAIDRNARATCHKTFEDIAGYLKEGDLLVMNDTRVIPARLFGKRKTGGKVEIFVLEIKGGVCEALVRPSGRLNEGEMIALDSGDEVEVMGRGEVGRQVKFSRALGEILESNGHVPLPPYIDRRDIASDKEDYQTVYARSEGATASPTAGLHFTRELLDRISGQGVKVSFVTLHTSYGTFAPVKSENIEEHKMHREYFELPSRTIEAVRETKSSGGRVFAVGTTSVRVLEHCAGLIENDERQKTKDERLANGCTGHTSMFIYPGYKFRIVDAMITNFHLPKSTLLLLVSAFAGKELVFKAYDEAIRDKYRFFSYGDAMVIV
jgi:S-adenosylmethionine:tRNA ribosyltransferase-isomerase